MRPAPVNDRHWSLAAWLSWTLLLAAAAARAAAPSDFAFTRDMAPEGNVTAGVGAVVLDEEVLAALDGGYANIRVFGSDDEEIPRLIRVRRRPRIAPLVSDVAMEVITLEELEQNRIRVVLRRKDDAPVPNAIVFKSRLKNFEKQVSVHGSMDGETWHALAEGQPIFDYSRYMDVRRDTVEFTAAAYSRYRVEVSNIAEMRQSPLVQITRGTHSGGDSNVYERASFRREDFRIEQLVFQEREQESVPGVPEGRTYAVNDLAVVHDAQARSTVITFAVAWAPLTSLILETPDVNFSRRLVVEGSDGPDGDERWRRVAVGTVSRIHMGTFRQDRTTIGFGAPRRFGRYRLTLDNQDSPALEVGGVVARGDRMEVVFFCAPGVAYRLGYGGGESERPNYDIEAVLSRKRQPRPAEYSLGAARETPGYEADRRRRFDGDRAMVVAVVLMAIVLVLVIGVASRRLDTLRPPQ